METFPTADSAAELYDILANHQYAPDDVDAMMCERLVGLAAERTQNRGESAFEQEKDYLFVSDWVNMVGEKLGWHNDRANMFALGTISFDRSAEKDAWFVDNAVVPQWGWLRDGDGRMTDVRDVDLTDGEYHDREGEMWWPKDYTVVVEFRDSLVKGDADLAGAM
jgi:hypothetical protein